MTWETEVLNQDNTVLVKIFPFAVVCISTALNPEANVKVGNIILAQHRQLSCTSDHLRASPNETLEHDSSTLLHCTKNQDGIELAKSLRNTNRRATI